MSGKSKSMHHIIIIGIIVLVNEITFGCCTHTYIVHWTCKW